MNRGARSGRSSVVCLGGGTGLPAVLRAIKGWNIDLTAIVVVTDDGGSSGALRRELQVLPPGDVRNCLVALADDDALMARLFQHRFSEGSLSGHALGNLFLTAMADLMGGFDRGIQEASRVLAIRGRVLPVTLEKVTLCARLADGVIRRGETEVSSSGARIAQLYLEPALNPRAAPSVIEAIRSADLVVLGPGSLFTSILPHFLVEGVARALRENRDAKRVYVCNIMTQPGETDQLTLAGHMETLLRYAGAGGLTAVLAHQGEIPTPLERRYGAVGALPVQDDIPGDVYEGVRIVRRELIDEHDHLIRHSPRLVGNALEEMFQKQGVGR